MKSLRHARAGRASGRSRRTRKWLLEQAAEARANARRPLTIEDCVYHGDDPEEPCWGAVTCWMHDATDHPGCEALCHGHRDCHPGNDFSGVYRHEHPPL